MIQKLALFIISIFLLCASTLQAQTASAYDEPMIVGYWHNFKNSAPQLRLIEIPDAYSIVNIAFASVNPNGTVNFSVQGPPYKLTINGKERFKEDIRSLQKKGVKVLLSLGGMNSYLHLDNDIEMNNFIQSAEQIIRDYGFDGVDYDFEGKVNPIATAYLLKATRKIKEDFTTPLLVSVCPESSDVHWQASQGKYDQLIDSGLIDLVFVQLYNTRCKRSHQPNSSCFSPGTQDFIVAQADSTIQSWVKRGIKNAESLYVIGLPAEKNASTNGYTDPHIIRKALLCLTKGYDCDKYKPTKTYPHLGGVMTWSINWDANNNYNFVNTLTE